MGLHRWLRDDWRTQQLVALQLRSGKPPHVRAAFERMRNMGLAPGRARRLIRMVLATEIRAMMRERRPFDDEGFARRLARLPDPAAVSVGLAVS